MKSSLCSHAARAAFGLVTCTVITSSGLDAQVFRRVPEHYASIQAAIDAATNGDTVSVAPGHYVSFITFAGKNITVRSRAGAASTIIDAGRNGSAVRFRNGETRAAVLEGFTVRGGSDERGGGIFIEGASPTIRCCVIRDNRAFEGGGIYFGSSNALVESSFLYANLALRRMGGNGGLGGAMYSEASTITLQHVSVSQNDAANTVGHGLHVISGSALVQNSIFHLAASIHYAFSANVTLNHCILNGPWYGAGVNNMWADPLFVDPGVDPTQPDLHLRHDSPARHAGMRLDMPFDVDGDPRAQSTPDIGADEFLNASHWYIGAAVSFEEIGFRGNGMPGDLVVWLLAGGSYASPLSTPWGPLWLDSTMLSFTMGPAPANGIVEYVSRLPWLRRTTFHSQVLSGPDLQHLTLSERRIVLLGGL